MEQLKPYNHLLLHIPHASISFPKDSHYSFHDLDHEERLLIDYFTDELFVPQHPSQRICSVVFPYCRLYCDVERLINDPLEKEGLGISYSRMVYKDNHPVLRSFSTLRSVFKQYADFHTEISMQLLEMDGSKLLIDCHSFSNMPNLLNSNPPDIDICIGYNDDATRPDKVIVGNIVQHFKVRDYKIGINNPFSNSKTFSVPTAYHSVMIEVNKRLYMNEHTLLRTAGFDKLKQDIESLYSLLIE